MRSRAILCAASFAACVAGAASAQGTVATETLDPGNAVVTLHLHGFLTEQERTILRQIGSNADAMRTFLGGQTGYAAIAASPAEGFFRKGAPVASAVALSQLPDAESARRGAIAACQRAAKARAACVPVLEVAPRR
jgi:hypothetical protein